MSVGAFTSIQPTLIDICQSLYAAAITLGGTDAMTPYATMIAGTYDTQQVLLVKISYWATQIAANASGGGGSGSAFTVGTGSPEGVVSGSPGDRFWATDTDFEYVKVTGTATTTGWSIH